MKALLIKPVKHDLSSRSSVFTPVSPISETEILSGKYISGKILPDTGYYWIAEFYQIPDTGIQYIPSVHQIGLTPHNLRVCPNFLS